MISMGKIRSLVSAPLGAVIMVGAIILTAEFVIMLVVENINRYVIADIGREATKLFFEFADPFLLILFVSPALFILIFRPMRVQQFELSQQAEQLNLAITSANQAWFNVMIPTGEVSVSVEYPRMLGFDPNVFDTSLSNWFDSIHPDDRVAVLENFKECMDSKGQFTAEYRCLNKLGNWFWISSIGKVVEWDGAQKPVRLTGIHMSIVERKAAEKKIEHLAFYDPLTNLPNRRLFLDRLQHALASSERIGRSGALLLIDLDNFKSLNDTLGHQVGDLSLEQIAHRLESCVREGDTVARLGGDEFMVMLENLNEQALESAAQTGAIGEKILAVLNQPYLLDTNEYLGTASIGATLFQGHSQSPDELVKQADIAMYHAKQSGRNTVRFFDQIMQENITSRFLLENELRKALEKQEFQLYYQIQRDNSLHPLGAEVLIRWIHPLRGMVSPADFIPLAEETGAILPIGQWVLESACAQIKAWERDELTRDLVLAVNVSAKQFSQADFAAQVQVVVQRHAINPKRLKLELTESMLVENIEEYSGPRI